MMTRILINTYGKVIERARDTHTQIKIQRQLTDFNCCLHCYALSFIIIDSSIHSMCWFICICVLFY